METEKRFKTKTGFCHVLPDKIVLTRDGIIGSVANATLGNNINRTLLIYGGITIGLFYFAFDSYKTGAVLHPIVCGILGLFLIYGIVNSLNNSATPTIERKSIKDVKLKKSIPGLTRSRFEVLFENENGKIMKRLIMLPGSMTGGKKETEKAIRIMTEEKLLD